MDIIYALKTLGTPLYGFGHIEDRKPESRAEYMRKKRADAMAEKERMNQRDKRIRRAGGVVRARAQTQTDGNLDQDGDEVMDSVED